MKKLISMFISLALIGVVVSCITLVYLRSQPLPTAYIPQTSKIYDIQGHIIDSFHTGENRQIIKLDQISPFVIQATLSIEDHRFYNHIGLDVQGMARAAWVDLKEMAMVEGASTITQQLARNLYLTHEKTWSRKLKEALLAVQLEMQYSKNEIITQYLNTIYYGHATYGIQAAAVLYFNKSAKDLTLAESALLAGVPKGPKYYSPYMDEVNAKDRQWVVLQSMVNHGHISQKEADQAYAEALVYMPLTGSQPSKAPFFKDYIMTEAMERLGVDEDAFDEGGYHIYTTLDMRSQVIAEEVVEKHLGDSELQVALISVDPRNGYVKAMVGGRDYDDNQYNRVFTSTRQPGSAFKPIVYLTALQNPAFTAVTQFKSEPTIFTYDDGKKTYTPSNFGGKYPMKNIDLRQAISKSDNIFAVQTLMQVGAEQVIAMARKLGIQSYMGTMPSLALGTYPVSPFEMSSAFATIANQGGYIEPKSIARIEDGSGKVLYEDAVEAVQVVEPEYTYVLTSLLEGVFDLGGTGSRVAHTIKRPVAGKTGTTNTDSWMVGFTPELSTAVWVGYDRDRTISSVESMLAAPIFAEFTERALEPIPPKLFPVPRGVVSVYIDPASGKLASASCPDSRLEHFVQGTQPTEYCAEHYTEPKGLFPVPQLQEQTHDQHSSWWRDLKRWWND